MTDQTDAELIAEARGHAEDAEAGRTTGNASLYRALSDRLRALIRLSDELEAVRIERDNWRLTAEEAERAEKRWKDCAVEADRQARAAEAEAEHLHVEDTREIVALTQERNQYAAVLEKVRLFAHGQATEIRAQYGATGPAGYLGFANACEDVLDILAASPADILRELKAAAWAEGHDAGWEDRHQDALAGWMPSDPYESEAVNPYRAREAGQS